MHFSDVHFRLQALRTYGIQTFGFRKKAKYQIFSWKPLLVPIFFQTAKQLPNIFRDATLCTLNFLEKLWTRMTLKEIAVFF